METDSKTASYNGFKIFDKEHAIILGVLLSFGYFLLFFLPAKCDEQWQLTVGKSMAWILCITALSWTFIKWYAGDFDFRLHLPLDICNLSTLLIPVLMYTQADILYQVLFYVIIAGTLQGLITPDLDEVFPHYTYFKYWIVHGGLVLVILYATYVLGFRPTYTGLWFTFMLLQPYALAIFFFNKYSGANYAYLARKPENPTLLDHLGRYPYYILSIEGISLVAFHIIYMISRFL